MSSATPLAGNPDALPEPPDTPPARLPGLVTEMVTMWRLHWEADPRQPRRYPTGRYRFDAPHGEYPVTYGNRDQLPSFREVYSDARLIGPEQGARLLSCLVALRPLPLIPLDDVTFRDALDPRLDARLTTAIQYETPSAGALRSTRGIRTPKAYATLPGMS